MTSIMLRRGQLALALIALTAPAAAPAATPRFAVATGCVEQQAVVEGDEAAVAARLPDKYAPLRGDGGAPLLFVRAFRCDAISLGARSAPATTMANFGVLIESPDGRGCGSAAPGLGALDGDQPPICNWYTLSWLADNRSVVEWLRAETPLPAVYTPKLVFELAEFDSAKGGAPFQFRTPASSPSAFSMDAVRRERSGEIAVRGGYWAVTRGGTVKLAFSTDNLLAGDSSGVVTAPPGSLLAALMGAGEREQLPEYAGFSALRWQRSPYRKQNLDRPAGDRFEGSCAFEGLVRFTPPATNTEARDLVYDWAGSGLCTGTLNGREVSDAAAKAHQKGEAHATCGEARTTSPGQGAITFPGGETVRSTLDFTSTGTEVDLEYYGERSGFAGGHATFLTDRTPPDVVQKCESEEGVKETPLDVELTTQSPLVSELRRLKLRVRPRTVQAGERRRFRFRVTSSEGRPVRRALVRFAGRRARTGRRGRAAIVAKLNRPRRHRARATHSGFRAARVAVIVRG